MLIIGAGPAGVGAARTLINSGVSPVILEARSRIGGRVFQEIFSPNLRGHPPRNYSVGSVTDISDDEDDLYEPKVIVQLGANWVHGLSENINPYFTVAKHLKLDLHPTSPDDYPGADVCLFNCSEVEAESLRPLYERVSAQDYDRVLSRYQWITTHISDCLCDGSDMSLRDAFALITAASEDASLPYGACSETDRHCLNWCLDRIAIDSGLSLDKVSTRSAYYAAFR